MNILTSLVLFLLFCQALGACVGVFTAMWGEIAYIHSMADGKVDAAERAHLRIIAHGLRFGMMLSLIASLALVGVSFTLREATPPALTASYWIFMALALFIVGVSWTLSRRHISFALGSAAILTAWWLLAYLTLGRFPLSFGATVAFYIVLTAVIYAILRIIRFLSLRFISSHKR